MTLFKTILLVDDSPRDTEMTLHSLESYKLSNRIVTAVTGASEHFNRQKAFRPAATLAS